MRTRAPLELLRCPATGRRLVRAADGLATEDGGRVYPVVRGVPVLIDEARSIVRIEEVVRSGGGGAGERAGPARRLADRLTPATTLNPGAGERIARFTRLVQEAAGGRPRVLVVGGGRAGGGMARLLDAPEVDVLSTDIYVTDLVGVACDGHQLPFADGAFDGVVVQAVLEHVLEPWTVVAEIHRVLAPHGLVYAETPFMQQVHEGAFDFTRFTPLGHRRLFRMFAEVDSGVAVGPASALVWALRYFARALPRDSRAAAGALDRLTRLAFAWLRHLDRRLASHRGAGDAASGVYFLGRRAESPVDDRALLESYRGTLGSVAVARGLSSPTVRR